jgi:DNA segregation ATPase FtsK/SpoIIIE, S-DNA-T family
MSIDPKDDSIEHEAEIIDLTGSRRAPAPDSAPPADDDQGDDAPRVLVDSPEAQRDDPLTLSRLRAAERRPVLAAWLRSRVELRVTAAWALRYAAHVTAFHAARVPTVYAGRLALRSPRGAWRIASAVFAWVFDLEGHPVRVAAVDQADSGHYLRLSKQRNDRVKVRGTAALIVALPLALAAVAVALWGGPVLRTLAGVALVAVAGAFGRRPDKPLLDTAVSTHKVPKLTSDIVRRALSVAVPEIRAALAKDPGAVEFVDPIQRDGQGYRAPVNLPYGVTVGDVMGQRPRLASGLRRQLGCVWPEGDPGQHEGRLILWVGDKDLAELRGKKGLPWALAHSGHHDVFRPVPFGADPRGRSVSVPLFQHNVLIGSIPGQGKTGAATVLACGVALDPLAELWIHELKGSGDLDPLAQVAHRFISGIDDESIGYAADSLTLLRAEVVRRTAALKKLPPELCSDKRVTREIAAKRSLGLHPVVCVIDEAQNLFAHVEYGRQAAEDAEFIIRIGRAFGVILILATQRPDKDSLPSGVKGNVSIRFCLYVPGQVENDMILGTGAYKRGVNAAALRPEIDAGIGYLVGTGSAPVVACAARIDGPALERIARRARALRTKAGTLSGHALGEAPEVSPRITPSLLTDILAVVPAGEAKVWGETALDRLAELRPEVYGAWSREQLTAALRSLGVDATEQVWGTDPLTGQGANRRGFARQAVADATTERDRHRRSEGPA